MNAVRADASGADLSGLDLADLSVFMGAVRTEETTWPPGARPGQLQSRVEAIPLAMRDHAPPSF